MCIDETTILRLLAGSLPADERDAAQAHLAQCPACRQLFESLQQTWNQLGAWNVALPERDLTAGVLAVAHREISRNHWHARGRIAAAILLAGSIGWIAGRLSPSDGPPIPPIATEEMAQKTGLDTLVGDISALSAVFPDESEFDDASATGGRS